MGTQNFLPKLVLAAFLSAVFPQLSHGQGNDNPTGPTGEYSGSITTGGSYDPYTGNAKRVVEDFVVPGCVGVYPLKWTRTLNTRILGTPGRFGPHWTHSYSWALNYLGPPPPPEPGQDEPFEFPEAKASCPDGRTVNFWEGEFGDGEGPDGLYHRLIDAGSNQNHDLILPDGGKVRFRRTAYTNSTGQTVYAELAKEIVDPFGMVTTLAYDSKAKLTRVTEPGGRYLQINYVVITTPAGSNDYVGSVQAVDGRGNLMETVTYTYTTVVLTPNIYVPSLTGAAYNDGTAATYTNQAAYVGAMKSSVVTVCDDPRYPGAMRKIEYEYMSGSGVALGQVKREKNATTHQTVSEVINPTYNPNRPYNDPTGYVRTEKRGDTTTRTFQYYYYVGSGSPGTLLSYTDFKGQSTSISYGYSAPYNVKTVTDARGKVTQFCREGIGALKKVIRHDSSFVQFGYSDSNNPYYLISRTDERGNTTGYVRDGNNRIQRTNYPDSSYETFTFNSFGQVLTHRRKNDDAGSADAPVSYEHFEYDGRGLLRKKWNPTTSATPVEAEPKTTYVYYGDVAGAPASWIDRVKTATDPRGYTTTFEYNLRGQVTKVIHPDGNYTQSSYNADGTLAWTADENHPGAATDANQRTRYTYDEYKRVLTVTNLLNQTVTNSYAPWNGSGSLSHTTASVFRATSPMGKITDQEFDQNFRKTRVRQATGTADDASSYLSYDVVGNVVSTTDPRGNVTASVYDDRNRPISVTNALNQTTSTTYDVANNKTSETRPNGEVITYVEYDSMNRLKQKKVKRDATTFDFTYMDYFPTGDLKKNRDENGNDYTYKYDEANRLKSMVYPGGLHEDKTYDAAGNLATYTTRTGVTQIQTFTYDNRNRATDFSWNDGLTSWQHTVYDSASRVTEISNNVSTIKHTYDNANRLLTQEEWTSQFSDNVHRTVTYTYDADGNRTTVQYPSGQAFNYTYTNRSQASAIKPGLSGGTPIVSYTYDVAGNITNRSVDNGTSSTYTRDQLNRVSGLQHNLTSGAKRFDYAFNSVSDITAVQRDSALGDGFEYDLTQQITKFHQNGTVNLAGGIVSAPATSNNMVFDGCGNRTSLNGVAQTFDNLNQLTPAAGISHNAKGDLTAWNGWTYIYDAQNRLISASSASSTLSFYYDARNRQIARSINNGTDTVNTFSVWDDWELIEEYTTGNVRTAAFVQGAHGPIKSLVGNSIYFYQDSLGSTSHIAGSNGALLEYYKYDLNGKPTYWNASGQITTSTVKDLFAGERYISELGLYDNRNRFYSPDLGRFLQPDPIGFKGDGSNLYRYCGNDWANRTDPDGLIANFNPIFAMSWWCSSSTDSYEEYFAAHFSHPSGGEGQGGSNGQPAGNSGPTPIQRTSEGAKANEGKARARVIHDETFELTSDREIRVAGQKALAKTGRNLEEKMDAKIGSDEKMDITLRVVSKTTFPVGLSEADVMREWRRVESVRDIVKEMNSNAAWRARSGFRDLEEAKSVLREQAQKTWNIYLRRSSFDFEVIGGGQ